MLKDSDGGEQAIACNKRLTIQVTIVIPHMIHQNTLALVLTDVKSRQKKDSIASLTVHKAVQMRYKTANWYLRKLEDCAPGNELRVAVSLNPLKVPYITGNMHCTVMLRIT